MTEHTVTGHVRLEPRTTVANNTSVDAAKELLRETIEQDFPLHELVDLDMELIGGDSEDEFEIGGEAHLEVTVTVTDTSRKNVLHTLIDAVDTKNTPHEVIGCFLD